MRGIYAHKNKLNNKIFYIGQQRIHNDRSNQFNLHRSDKYLEYVKNIGEDNIEVIWLHITEDEDENLFPIESYYQNKFHSLEMVTGELFQEGEMNSNYGNFWSERKKKKQSNKVSDGRRKGAGNARATSCTLFGPEGQKIHFDYLGAMDIYVGDNILKSGKPRRVNENKPANYDKAWGHKFDALRGWYYIRDINL